MFESLAFLSDEQVRDGGRAAVANEREATLTVLNFLIEIEKRKLYLDDGYSSIFDFCTSAWGYSSSSAWRRIQTARCILRFPRVLALLERDEVNLSTIAQASRVLNEENCDALLVRICGKSQREVESIASEYREESAPRERARTVAVRLPDTPDVQLETAFGFTPAAPSSPDPTSGEAVPPTARAERPVLRDDTTSLPGTSATPDEPACENSDYCRSGSNGASVVVGNDAESIRARVANELPNNEPLNPDHPASAYRGEGFTADVPDRMSLPARTSVVLQKRVALALSVPVEFMAKIERLRAVTWHRLPAGASFTQVLDFALDVAIAAKDPAVRHRRRKKRAEKPRNTKTSTSKRYIPAHVRDEVARRDAHQCTYVSGNGRRCTATTGLQVDHILPIARGGMSTIDNLRLLCAKHNRFEAERLMGDERKARGNQSRE